MLKNRKIEKKIITRINKSKSNAFILSDFRDLSDKNQVSRTLRKLVKNEFLFKLGQGIYAKTKVSPIENKRILVTSFLDIAKEALEKLKIKSFPSQAEMDYNSGKSTQVPTGLRIAVNKHVSRKISYNGRTITYEKYRAVNENKK